MALAWSSTAQNRVAYLLFNAAYSTLTTAQKQVIDGEWTTGSLASGVAFSSFTQIQQVAQYFELAGATVTSDAAMPWLIDDVVYRASISLRPERQNEYRDIARVTRDAYLASTTPTEITSGLDTDPYALTAQAIRFYVLSNMVIRKPPVMMHPREIDNHTFGVLTWLWNSRNWSFRRRPMAARIVPVAFTTGNWVESTKTISNIDTTDYPTHIAGTVVYIRSGTGVVKGPFRVASRPGATSITTTASIAAAGGDLTNADITGYIVSFVPYGLPSGETLNGIANLKLHYQSADKTSIEWSNSDRMIASLSDSNQTTGTPAAFRLEKNTDTLTWHFFPIPDTAYTVNFDGLIALPGTSTSGVPTSATDTVPFAKFPREFIPIMKQLVLGRCLIAKGITAKVWDAAVEEIDTAGLAYDDKADIAASQNVVRDANHDVEHMRSTAWGYGYSGSLGGGL